MMEIVRELETIPWTSDRFLLSLTRQHIISVLFRFLNGQLSAEDVRDWAEEFMGREDIAYEAGYSGTIAEVLMNLWEEQRLGAVLTPAQAETYTQTLSQAVYDPSDKPEG
jgi:hypothetical protein